MLDLAIGTVLENLDTGKRLRIAEMYGPGQTDDITVPCVRVNWGQSADDKLSLLMNTEHFTDEHVWKVIEPYVCGACGHRFYEETPAGRCPREADHFDGFADDDDEPTDPIFRVYAIADGAVDGDEWEGDDYTDALLAFSKAFNEYTELRERGELECEVTLHLYEPAWGNLLHERTITRSI